MDDRMRSTLFFVHKHRLISFFCITAAITVMVSGCLEPAEHREKADKVAYRIIQNKQLETMGMAEDFSLVRPSDLLRRRLLTGQGLQFPDETSLGSDKLAHIEYWPDPGYLRSAPDNKSPKPFVPKSVMNISLIQALQIGARNSFAYQSEKEDIFKTALRLDLEMNDFRSIFAQEFESRFASDSTGDKTVSGTANSSNTSVSKKLENGTVFTADLAVDLINLLSTNTASSVGVQLDTSVSIPLLRGSGKHIVREPLTQAERDIAYEIYGFDKFKRAFAVDIASEYLSVLRRLDQVKNTKENYRSLIFSVRRARRMADAGELPEIQVDQAVQNELRARDRWIGAIQSYENGLDSFKILLGLPTDARIELDRSELEILVKKSEKLTAEPQGDEEVTEQNHSAEDEIVLAEPGIKNAGPLEIDVKEAIGLAFDNRCDLKVAQGRVYDAQRDVVVAADDLRAELTLFGSAKSGGRRSVASADREDGRLRGDKLDAYALLTLDLPIERTQERDEYRNSLISMEKTLRDKNQLEDKIKLEIRNDLRSLLQARESIQIQAKSVAVANKRINSTNMFFEAGRAEIRDILEAQDSLLSAQNSLTAAVTDYRVSELDLQRDMGLLKVGADGKWQEYRASSN
jgi:outer membrane protein TolC